jgi:uncharacterized RDD family membrane protein YckC
MPIAGIGSRFIAIVVDYLIWAAVLTVCSLLGLIVFASVHMFSEISANWMVGIVLIAIFVLHWGYFTLFEAFGNGRTPGKSVAKIRVIHRSGRAASFVESLARNLVRIIDYLPGLYGVGLVVMFFSRQNQRLGDMVAGTLVVRDREIETPHWGESGSLTFTAAAVMSAAPLLAPHLSVSLPVSGLAKLSTADLEVLESFFARRLDMDMATRAALAERMALALSTKSNIEIPAGVSMETFLEAVAHQLREVARMN